MENAVPRQMLAIETARIGAVKSQFCGGMWKKPVTVFQVPSGPSTACHKYAATTSGSTQAPMTNATSALSRRRNPTASAVPALDRARSGR